MSGFWAQLGQKIEQFLIWALTEHPGKLIGSVLGFLVGIFVVIIGFWKTLVIVLFVIIGFLLGKRKDDNLGLLTWLNHFLEKDYYLGRRK